MARRRKLVWARMAPAITSLSQINASVGGAIESQDLLTDFRTLMGIGAGPPGITIMRIRMHISYLTSSSIADQLTSGLGVYYGIKVCDLTDLVSQETTELPSRGPQIDKHADWMAWGRVPVKNTTSTSAGAVTFIGGWEDVDVRSMRKIDELGQTLGLWVQATNSAGGANSGYQVSTSVLVALP